MIDKQTATNRAQQGTKTNFTSHYYLILEVVSHSMKLIHIHFLRTFQSLKFI